MDPDPFRDHVQLIVDTFVPVQDVSRLILSYYGRGTLGFIISKDSRIQSRQDQDLDPSNTQVYSYDSGQIVELVLSSDMGSTCLTLFGGFIGSRRLSFTINQYSQIRLRIGYKSYQAGYVLQNPHRLRFDLSAFSETCTECLQSFSTADNEFDRVWKMGRCHTVCYACDSEDRCNMCHRHWRKYSFLHTRTRPVDLFPEESAHFGTTSCLVLCPECHTKHFPSGVIMPKKQTMDLRTLRDRYHWKFGLPLSIEPLSPETSCFFRLDDE